ncbi:MAG: hypothetical protein ACRBF0_04780 [Calditrichia bacterium]
MQPMRLQSLFLMLATIPLLLSCAPGFKSFHQNSPLLLSESNNDSLTVRYSFQPFSSSPKFATKAAKDQLAAFYIEITNLSDSTIEILPNSFAMHSRKKKLSPTPTEQLVTEYRSNSAVYMLWSFFFITYWDEDSFIPIPIGFPIGLGQMARSDSYNKKMRAEFDQNSYKNVPIPPGGSTSGHLYFRNLTDHKWTLSFDYEVTGERRESELVISRSAMAPVMTEWRRRRLHPVR